MITIFKNFLETKSPHYITIQHALERIKSGKSDKIVLAIRAEQSDEKRDALKKSLPCVLFSGAFSHRANSGLKQHSGFIVLDFDKTGVETKEKLMGLDFIYACWLSPSGNGYKALVKISNPSYHRQHFLALQDELPEIDPSGKDVARICFESYDPDIYINEKASIYEMIIEERPVKQPNPIIELPETDELRIYNSLKRYAEKKGELFVSGNRNNYIMRMAASCNRTGVTREGAKAFMAYDFGANSGFSLTELNSVIEKVYKMYAQDHGKYPLAKKIEETEFRESVFDPVDIPIDDLIYFDDVWEDLMTRRAKGAMKGETTYIPGLDNNYRWMRGEITCVNGYGNHGKSTFVNFLQMLKAKNDGYKFVSFSPENFPADYYYADLLQMWGSASIDKHHRNPIKDENLGLGKAFINDHFFNIYPEKVSPTPEFILKRFQEVIIKHKVDGVLIDPFNQLDHSLKKSGMMRDEYLSEIFSMFSRFAKNNNIFFHVIAHPKAPTKNKNGTYDVPTVYDLAGGAMWNNKFDNILCYNRPYYFDDPFNPACDLHVQKIKKQGVNGGPGMVEFTYDREKFLFLNRGVNPMEKFNKAPAPDNRIEATKYDYEQTTDEPF